MKKYISNQQKIRPLINARNTNTLHETQWWRVSLLEAYSILSRVSLLVSFWALNANFFTLWPKIFDWVQDMPLQCIYSFEALKTLADQNTCLQFYRKREVSSSFTVYLPSDLPVSFSFLVHSAFIKTGRKFVICYTKWISIYNC